MARNFSIHYNTSPSESLVIETKKTPSGETETHAMQHSDGVHTYTDNSENEMWYRYKVVRDDGEIAEHHFHHLSAIADIEVYDTWRSPEMPADALKAEAFANAVFSSDDDAPIVSEPQKGNIAIRLTDPRLGKDEAFCIVMKQFISWNVQRAFVMTRYNNFTWQYEFKNDRLLKELEFKFGIWDLRNNCFKRYEEGENHIIKVGESTRSILVNYDSFYYEKEWRVAGVAVPVFSLRTRNSRGCGEFADIKALADWCVAAGLKVIQLLPINDTTANNNFKDSYPYNAISVMALHPNYISVQKVYEYYGERIKSLDRETGLYINDLNMVDYDRTHQWKLNTLQKLFNAKFNTIINDEKFTTYIEKNRWWVLNYAAFAYLRDKYRTPNFRQWQEYSEYNSKMVDALFAPQAESYKQIMFNIFVQYHLENQLSDATNYCHENGIAIKGDLPIGINPNSVEAWVEPNLFDFSLQAGAPPDFFSRDGQNWGFPIYNWDKMSQNGYKWWERRMVRMQQFFDVFRIDHILGFFRIWAIPHPFKSGLMGIFSPALPLSAEEIKRRGFTQPLKNYTHPIVSKAFIDEQLGEYASAMLEEMFEPCGALFRLKDEYLVPSKAYNWIDKNVVKVMSRERIRYGYDNIVHEVLFVSIKRGEYHPRIMLTQTARYSMLSADEQNALRAIHDDFFFNRHNEFWKEQATRNLSGMLRKCKMLVCGEDLGMIPASVPIVMKRMQILALELQRMPKLSWERYGNCSKYDYLSVCATSSHDISSIRGWWEENAQETQWYYNNILNHEGKAPHVANGKIVAEIIRLHMQAPSVLCINPIQDYAGTVDHMPHLLPHEERINEPSNPNNYWRYRIPFCIDEATEKYPLLHQNVRKMVEESGRLQNY